MAGVSSTISIFRVTEQPYIYFAKIFAYTSCNC
jgi:hypothetical protein